jgi:type IV secretory pathway TrbD component
MINQKISTPLLQSLTRPILILGGERENIILLACLSLGLCVAGRDILSLILALLIWSIGIIASKLTAKIANSAESGLLRLEQLIMEAGVVPVPEAIAEAVNLLVFIQKTNKGKKGRQVTSILKLKGYDKTQGYLTEA